VETTGDSDGGQAAEQNEKADARPPTTSPTATVSRTTRPRPLPKPARAGGQHEASDGDGESPNR
jgi:hypothetical protein